MIQELAAKAKTSQGFQCGSFVDSLTDSSSKALELKVKGLTQANKELEEKVKELRNEIGNNN